MSNQIPFYLWKRIDGEKEHDRFGDRIVCGDINGDGQNEWLISASTATCIEDEGGVNPIPSYFTGRVYIYAADFQLLFTLEGEKAGDCFGTALAIADVNGDGMNEILVGAPRASTSQRVQCGSVFVYAGTDGSLLQKWDGQEDYAHLGGALTAIDWNEDGVLDIAVSSHLFDGNNGDELDGAVTIFAYGKAEMIEQLRGKDREQFGFSLAAGDINGDGRAELIIGAPHASSSGLTDNGQVLIYSISGKLIRQFHGKRSFDEYGHSIAIGDLDGDGIDDLLVGSPRVSSAPSFNGVPYWYGTTVQTIYKNSGMLSVISIAQNKILLEKTGWFPAQGLGASILPLVDTADGTRMLMAGSSAGTSYLFDLHGKLVHEFAGHEPDAFSHSLAACRNDKGLWIAIGAVSGLNRNHFLSGSVYVMSESPPASPMAIEQPKQTGHLLPAKQDVSPARIAGSKQKILLATYWYLPHVGGVDVYVRVLKEKLEQQGFQVDVLAHHPDMAHYYLVGGNRKIQKWPIKQVIYDKVSQFYQRYLPHVEPWIRWRDIERYCFEAAATLFDLEQYDIIHTQDIVSTRALSRVKPASAGHVATIHGLLAKEHLFAGDIKNSNNLSWKYVAEEEYHGCTSADATIVPTDWLRREMFQFRVQPEQLIVIPYGMDIPAFEQKTTRPLSKPVVKEGTFTIGCPARLVPVKGHKTLLGALRRLAAVDAGWHCWLAGDGILRSEIEQLIQAYGLSGRITLLGDRDDVPVLLKQMDLMVLPSLQDNLPFSIMEAQLAGTPIVASNAGGIPEMIQHEKTGLLFEAGNEQQLSEQILRAVTDPNLRIQLAQTARKWAARQWSAETLLERTLKVYEAVLNSKRG